MYDLLYLFMGMMMYDLCMIVFYMYIIISLSFYIFL